MNSTNRSLRSLVLEKAVGVKTALSIMSFTAAEDVRKAYLESFAIERHMFRYTVCSWERDVDRAVEAVYAFDHYKIHDHRSTLSCELLTGSSLCFLCSVWSESAM